MSKTETDSPGLSSRQRARQALEREKKDLEAQEKALSRVFAQLDRRDKIDRHIGQALRDAKGLGMTKASLAKQTGLGPKEVSTLLALESDDSDNEEDEGVDRSDAAGDGLDGDQETDGAAAVSDHDSVSAAGV